MLKKWKCQLYKYTFPTCNVKFKSKLHLAQISPIILILTFLKLQELSWSSRFSVIQGVHLLFLLFYKEKDQILCFVIFEDSSIVKTQSLYILFTVYQLLQALRRGDASAYRKTKVLNTGRGLSSENIHFLWDKQYIWWQCKIDNSIYQSNQVYREA